MKRVSISISIAGLLLAVGYGLNNARAQDAGCNFRCSTISQECSGTYITQCKAEASQALRRCEEAGGTSASCQASYDNTYSECMSRNKPNIAACEERQGCGRCYGRCGVFYCNCGSICNEGCGLEFDGGGTNSCLCAPDDPTCTSPIIVDVAGNGFWLTDALHGVKFDLRVTGQPIQTAWTSPDSDDSFLVLDRNGNGAIDDGTELFGDFTPQPEANRKNGFLALAEYDKPVNGGNSDGVISLNDTIYTSLRLWQDANHNGVSETKELNTLPAQGVETISWDYKESKHTDRHGNVFRYRAKVNGTKYAYDVFLTTEKQ